MGRFVGEGGETITVVERDPAWLAELRKVVPVVRYPFSWIHGLFVGTRRIYQNMALKLFENATIILLD